MQTEIKIPISMTLDIDGESAKLALYLVQVYCNKMGLLPIGKRQSDGSVKLEFEADWKHKQEGVKE